MEAASCSVALRTPPDVTEVERYLEDFPEITADRIYLMPQAMDRERLWEKSVWIESEAARRGWRMSPRLHVELFGNTRGT